MAHLTQKTRVCDLVLHIPMWTPVCPGGEGSEGRKTAHQHQSESAVTRHELMFDPQHAFYNHGWGTGSKIWAELCISGLVASSLQMKVVFHLV